MEFERKNHPHRRYNPLTGEWVLVSPHRIHRPWQGKREVVVEEPLPAYDPECYLCPGNVRANGNRNPHYRSTFVFTNDYSALLPDVPPISGEPDDLLRLESLQGTCRVICFSPRHDLTLAEMEIPDILKVVEVWIEQLAELGKTYRWVQIFENKGAMMGCSNPHPHGQIWASNTLPSEPAREARFQKDYWQRKGSVLLHDYLQREMAERKRLLEVNDHWVVLIPFWAVWPFETLLLPRRPVQRLTDLTAPEKKSLAAILKRILVRYDNLFEVSFPYTMGWHGAPNDGEDYSYWQLHLHFYPPLLRSATVKKFMVGYEMLAEAQRDITPEQAAERLKQVPEVHYKTR